MLNETDRKSLLEKHLETVPDNYRRLARKAYFRESHSRAVIKAKCCECVGYEDAVDRVRYCSTYLCPLWAYRPYQQKEKGSETNPAPLEESNELD